jgi:RNA polymerase sigma-70 factor (ECF subfamily)
LVASNRDADFEREALPHIDDVYRFALALTGSPHDAEDATQETFLRAYRSWHTYTVGTECRRWLFTICKNVIRNRPAPIAAVELDAFDADAETLAAVLQHSTMLRAGTEIAVDQKILGKAIADAIAKLPSRSAQPWSWSMSKTSRTTTQPKCSVSPLEPFAPGFSAAGECCRKHW